MKDSDLRKLVLKNKKNLKESDVYESERFNDLVRSLLFYLTRNKRNNVQVKIAKRDKNGEAAYTDGKTINIFYKNSFSDTFPTINLKVDSVLGLLFHEVGHLLYTNFDEGTLMINNIINKGEFLQFADISKNQKKASEEIQVYLKKYPMLKMVLVECISRISNIIEDVYIEAKLCAEYEGTVKMAIRMNTERLVEKAISVKKMKEIGLPAYVEAMNLILEYVSCGTYNNWENITDSATEKVDSIKELLDYAVTVESSYGRLVESTKILYEIWDVIKEEIDAKEQQISNMMQNQSNGSGDTQQNEAGNSSNSSSSNVDMIGSAIANEMMKEMENIQSTSNENKNAKTSNEYRGRDKDKASKNNHSITNSNSGGSKTNNSNQVAKTSTGKNESDDKGSKSKDGSDSSEDKTNSNEGGTSSEESEKSEDSSSSKNGNDSSEDGVNSNEDGTNSEENEKSEDSSGSKDGNNSSEDGEKSEDNGNTSENTSENENLNNCDEVNPNVKSQLDQMKNSLKEMFKDGENVKIDSPSSAENAVGNGDISESSEEGQLNDELTKSVIDMVNSISKDMAYEEAERSLARQLSAEANSCKLNDIHKNTDINIHRRIEVDSREMNAYETIKRANKRTIDSLIKEMENIVEKKDETFEKNRFIGKKLNKSPIQRDGRIFTKRNVPDDSELAVAILIDESGSMYGDRIKNALNMSIIISEFCEAYGIALGIYGHNSNGYDVDLDVYKEFDSIDGKDKYRLTGMNCGGCNRDGAALQFVGNHLYERPEEKKILIIISDGQPNAYSYGGDEAAADLRQIKNNLRGKEIILIAAAIGDDKDNIQDIYGKSYLNITDLKKMPKIFAKIIEQYMI